jgi:hypothetical protein
MIISNLEHISSTNNTELTGAFGFAVSRGAGFVAYGPGFSTSFNGTLGFGFNSIGNGFTSYGGFGFSGTSGPFAFSGSAGNVYSRTGFGF